MLNKPRVHRDRQTAQDDAAKTESDRTISGVPSLNIRGDETIQRIQRLRDDLRHVQERWNNRLVLEDRSLWECYFDGGAEILLYGDWGAGTNKINYAVRIPANRAVLHSICANPGVDVLDVYDGDHRYEIIVLIVVTETGSGPQMEICIPARLYIFDDKVCKVGEGLLYRRVIGGGFKVFPFFRKREIDFLRLMDGAKRGVNPIVQGFSEVVNSVSDDRPKMICDWLFGPIGQVKTIRLSQKCNRPPRPISDLIQVFGQGGRILDKRINVAIGPFDL